MKQIDVAMKAGLSLKALARLERGEGSSVETFVRALNALGAADVISKLAPEPGVSPLALLRRTSQHPQRVRDRVRQG